ncbi:MAG TPA: LysR substrate-binding domain-containing protein [Hyphomicrobiales bacterium]|nr:LysR substrate-binding domain-containing protein [Hyphomicrobiales bacterium]
MQQDLNDLYFFARVVEHGGFAAAARALGLPRSRLSRRIGLLEVRLGTRLIQRSTRRFAVTDIGREYYRHCVAMLVEAEAADEAVQRVRSEPQGLVRVSCPPSLLYFQIGGMIARFMAACPKVEVQIEATNRRVDVIRESFDLAIRARVPPIAPSDLVMKVLAESPQRLVASPALLQQAPPRAGPADLGDLPALAWGPPQETYAWHLDGPDGVAARVPFRPRLVTEDMATLRVAALGGIGIAQMPTLVVGADLAVGTLVEVLPRWVPRTALVHAVFPSRRGLLPSVRALLDFLAEEYAQLGGGGDRPGGKAMVVPSGR